MQKSQVLASGDEWRASNGDNVVVFRALEGRYPDYMRVLPKECSGETGIYNAEYLMRVQDAVNDFSKGKSFASIAYNGTGAAVATIASCPQFVAVIMPMRGDIARPDEWAWAFEPMKREVTATASPEVAAMIDPSGALQAAGLVTVAA